MMAKFDSLNANTKYVNELSPAIITKETEIALQIVSYSVREQRFPISRTKHATTRYYLFLPAGVNPPEQPTAPAKCPRKLSRRKGNNPGCQKIDSNNDKINIKKRRAKVVNIISLTFGYKIRVL